VASIFVDAAGMRGRGTGQTADHKTDGKVPEHRSHSSRVAAEQTNADGHPPRKYEECVED
jgi:hypothetical protein